MVWHHAVREDPERDSPLRLRDDFQERAVVGNAFKEPVAAYGAVQYMENDIGSICSRPVGHIEA